MVSTSSDLTLQIAFRVGVTGHRSLPDAAVASLRATIRDCLSAILDEMRARERGEGATLRIVSPLAEGSDRLVAEEGLRLGAELAAALPFAQSDYELDFPDSVEPFRGLLARAAAFTLDGSRESETEQIESYREVGHFVVRNSDMIIAIWDGARERGVGGTGEIVRFAVASGVPVWWIDKSGVGPARLLRGAGDLGAPGGAPEGVAAVAGLRALVSQAVTPPQAPPQEHAGMFGRLAQLGAKEEPSPLETFFAEKPLPPSPPWGAHARLMSWLAPGPTRRPAPREPPRSPLEHYWDAWFEAADRASHDYGDRYRSSYVLIALAAVIALSVAAVAGESPPGAVASVVAVEILALFGIAWLVTANQRRRWHERWISYRLLAELCRKQYALCSIGRSLPTADVLRLTFDSVEAGPAPREAWVAWCFMAATRAAAFPLGEMAAAKHRALEIGRSLLAEQIEYHEQRLASADSAGRRIGFLSELFFGLTMLIAVAKFVGALGEAENVVKYGGLLGALLAAGAGACVGIRAYAEFSLLSRQSAYMLRVLRAASAELEAAALAVDQPLASRILGRTLHATVSAMMQDITGWAHLFRIKTIEAG